MVESHLEGRLGFLVDTVNNPGSPLLRLDDAGIAKNLEVAGKAGLAHRQRIHHLANAEFALQERTQNPHPRRVGKRFSKGNDLCHIGISRNIDIIVPEKPNHKALHPVRYWIPVSTFDAIVPAGGTIDPEFAAKVGTDQKALIEFNGQTMLESVLQALRDSGMIRNIVVVGSKEVQAKAANFAAIGLEQGDSGPENIFRGLAKLQEKDPNLDQALIVTCDLPFLSPEIVQRYLKLCPTDKDICVPVITAADFERMYPGTTSTYVKTKDGTFTIGGIFLMNAKKMPELRGSIEKVFQRRKSTLGMALLIGPAFILKYLTKTLRIRDLENKIESMFKCTGKAVLNSPVELAYDIDYLDDYEYAVKHLGALS